MPRLKFDRHRPLRFAIYARVSSDAKNPRSPEQQAVTIRDGIKRLGLTWVEVQCYQDVGITVRGPSRQPGLVAMLKETRSGRLQVELILVESLERVGRSEDISRVCRLLKKHGVFILDAKSNFADPATSADELLAAIDTWRETPE